jgi:hypothetical protein
VTVIKVIRNGAGGTILQATRLIAQLRRPVSNSGSPDRRNALFGIHSCGLKASLLQRATPRSIGLSKLYWSESSTARR